MLASLWNWLLNPSGLTAHGFCLSWSPGLVVLHAGSDAVIGLSYFSIPVALAWFLHQRRDLRYIWVIYAFVAFILACGTTHLMSILTLWVPAYGIEGLVKLATALLSMTTAIVLWPLIPRLVALPSPEQLVVLNGELSERIAEQTRTAELLRASEARVRAANAELERRVAERTADLVAVNEDLTRVVAERTTALAQRDLLLREVYHRVKNNLQVVDSLVVMQAQQLLDPDARAALLGLRSRVYALGLVHQQLMGSDNLRTFDIAPFLRELSGNLLDGVGDDRVSLSVEASRLDVGLDFAIPLGLLVTELVTNSLKHAFPDGIGKIAVALRKEADGHVVLCVSDDGRRASTSTDGARRSFGLSLVGGLVEQLQGTMTVRTDPGTSTEIRIPPPVRP
jgi:two-component sensor histidine kinase